MRVYEIETIATFKVRYQIEAKCASEAWLLATSQLNSYDEANHTYLGDQIISIRALGDNLNIDPLIAVQQIEAEEKFIKNSLKL